MKYTIRRGWNSYNKGIRKIGFAKYNHSNSILGYLEIKIDRIPLRYKNKMKTVFENFLQEVNQIYELVNHDSHIKTRTSGGKTSTKRLIKKGEWSQPHTKGG